MNDSNFSVTKRNLLIITTMILLLTISGKTISTFKILDSEFNVSNAPEFINTYNKILIIFSLYLYIRFTNFLMDYEYNSIKDVKILLISDIIFGLLNAIDNKTKNLKIRFLINIFILPIGIIALIFDYLERIIVDRYFNESFVPVTYYVTTIFYAIKENYDSNYILYIAIFIFFISTGALQKHARLMKEESIKQKNKNRNKYKSKYDQYKERTKKRKI